MWVQFGSRTPSAEKFARKFIEAKAMNSHFLCIALAWPPPTSYVSPIHSVAALFLFLFLLLAGAIQRLKNFHQIIIIVRPWELRVARINYPKFTFIFARSASIVVRRSTSSASTCQRLSSIHFVLRTQTTIQDCYSMTRAIPPWHCIAFILFLFPIFGIV